MKFRLFSLLLVAAFAVSPALGQRFTPAEKALILAKDTSQTMRIWLITNQEDSIFLRRKCAGIAPRADRKVVRHLIRRMQRTVLDSMSLGVGIAAPQVGVGRNLVLVQRFDKPGFPFEAYLNITIDEYSAEKQPCKEGCLSIPNQRGETKDRSLTIGIRYQTPAGKWREESVTGFTAVIFQHEVDHLNGILFTDHLKAETGEGKQEP